LPRRPGRIAAAVAVALILVLVFGRSAAVFYTDALWFDAVGHGAVFWTNVLAKIVARGVTGALGAAIIMVNLWYVLRQLGPVHLRRRYGNLEIAEQVPRSYLIAGSVIVAVLAGWWLSGLQFGGNTAIALLAWARSERWGISDPLFNRDLSFYIFGLPIYRRMLEYLLIVLVWSIMLIAIGYALVGAVRVSGSRWEIDDRPRLHFAILIAGLLVVLGVRYLLGRYLLLLDGGGFNGTIGYTDVNARLHARLVLGLLAFAAAGALVYGTVRRTWTPPATALGVFLIAAVGMGIAYPAIVQKIQVEPNQLDREREFIRWNMEFTRRAFGLDAIDRRPFTYRPADAAVWRAMAPVLERLPLWDPEPLRAAFTELESGKGYYHFPDVDYDRYGPGGAREQVAISVREYTKEQRDASPTWQNIHMNPLYTRGLGVVLAPAGEKRVGEPVRWLSGWPFVQRHPAAPEELAVREPSIYFGETMADYAIVGHAAPFRSLEDTVARQPPLPRVTTGVPLNSFLRVFAFAWAFGDQNLLFARELGDTSRMIFRRRVHERMETLAPFLVWDPEAHPIVADGRVVWMLDGYTVSNSYPLSREHEIRDVATLRYIRGAVKATVDAVTGEVALYAVANPDPILRTYRSIFHGMIRDWSEMPEAIRAHVRYPSRLFGVQADVLREYHLDRPEAFYVGQDVWELPQERPTQRQAGRPAYVLTRLPGDSAAEFLWLHPFIARERQNMTALLVARSDPPHYGELVLFDLPGDDQVKGPTQIHTIIEQDPRIAREKTLLDQRGSTVQFGDLRILPADSSIVYVVPLFLSAEENAIPQLQFVIVSDGTRVAMEETLASAVASLGGHLAAEPRAPPAAEEPRPADGSEWMQRALELMRDAEARLRAGDFAGFGTAWSRLKTLLEQRSAGATAR
jgi:uncharacterized membrane protein (UPF0182 family)